MKLYLSESRWIGLVRFDKGSSQPRLIKLALGFEVATMCLIGSVRVGRPARPLGRAARGRWFGGGGLLVSVEVGGVSFG
jgi:hypothetical protein